MSKKRLSSDKYYPWRNKWSTEHIKYPWERKYLNEEFLIHEQIRIRELKEWYKEFKKSKETDELEEASFYTVPVDLQRNWKKEIPSSWGIFGLSGLYNSPSVLVLGVFPGDTPPKYRPIRVTKSKSYIIRNDYHNISEKILVVYDWYQERSEKIYVDVPFEKRIISNLIEENFIPDKSVSESFQSPIMGAPPIRGNKGGISLSSLNSESKFAKEMTSTIEMMVPPEERQSKPPKKEYKGHKFDYRDGIKFKLAERPFPGNTRLSSIFSNEYSKITDQHKKRNSFEGEYSIFSSLVPDNEYSHTTKVKQIINNYMKNEINLPYDLVKYKNREKGLKSLQRMIDGEIWAQVVYSHQFTPILDNNQKILNNYLNKLKNDFDVLLTDVWTSDKEREMNIKSYFMDKRNLLRTAQSFARAEERNTLKKKDFEKTRGVIIDNFEELKRDERVKNYFIFADKSSSNKRYSIVQSYFIENKEAKIEDIWDEVKDYDVFHNKEDLEGLLDWMKKEKGDIIESSKGVYKWV